MIHFCDVLEKAFFVYKNLIKATPIRFIVSAITGVGGGYEVGGWYCSFFDQNNLGAAE